MYLSHLLVDMGNDPDRPRPGRLWLRNVYNVHQRLCMAFPSAKRKSDDADFLKPFEPESIDNDHVYVTRGAAFGFLFRIDPQSVGRAVILVQCAVKPDWEYAFHNAGYFLAAPPEVKLLNLAIKERQSLRFRLLANPTRKIDTKSGPNGRRRNGRRIPVRDEQLLGWLARRAKAAGFSIRGDSTAVQSGYVYVNRARDGNALRLRSARYDGILRVTDPAKLKEVLACGLGPGKAFGFGLLSVAPVDA